MDKYFYGIAKDGDDTFITTKDADDALECVRVGNSYEVYVLINILMGELRLDELESLHSDIEQQKDILENSQEKTPGP